MSQAQQGGDGNREITEKVQGKYFISAGCAALGKAPLVNTPSHCRAQTPVVTIPFCSLCCRWEALMSAKLYVLISWPDGSRVINMENIKEPRKPFHLYTVGEQVLARCPGFSGLYWGVVEGISGE